MRFDPRDRLGRIRVRWVAALAAIALVPLVVVVGAVPYQLVVQARLGASTAAAVERARESGDLGAVARRERVRLRVIEHGRVTEQHGRTVTSRWTNHVALQFVDRETGALVRAVDTADAPVLGTARYFGEEMSGSECGVVSGGRMLACSAWEVDDRGRLIVAEAAAVRTVSTLWSHRAPILAVVLQMLALALALGLWLGRRTVRPIHNLRREVAERTRTPVSTRPLDVEGRDEVAELARSFNELLLALKTQREANMDFVSEVAHELKTPITTIQQFIDLARAVDDSRLDRALCAVEDSCGRLNARVAELLELARASAGLPGLDREYVALDELLKGIVQCHHARVDLEMFAAQTRVRASERYLEIAIRNVLDNAAVHAESHIAMTLTQFDDMLVIRVDDDGPGIAQPDLALVFERFHSRRAGGTGLGLAMTRAVMRAHGGDACALPASAGARIELRLPLG